MKYRLPGVFKLTRDERKVYLCLREKRNAFCKLKISAGDVGLEFNWSDTKAGRVLSKLEDKGVIEVIQRGTGRRANLYRIFEIPRTNIILVGKRKKHVTVPKDISSLASSIRASRNTNPEFNVTQNHVQTGKKEEKILNNGVNTLWGVLPLKHGKRDRAGDIPDTHAIRLLSHVRRPPVSARPVRVSHFQRFKKKMYDPDQWNAVDVLCYYALLSESVRGIRPVIDWRFEVNIAKNLLNRYEDGGVSVKRLLQLGFWITPEGKSPDGLSWFAQAWIINRCEENWDHDLTMPELEDNWVFANLS